jgi:hypothetical protein
MRTLSFILLALAGTMILGLPLQSYADPQLDILLNIAIQARDNLSVTISQTSNVTDEIKLLFKQGSDETDQLSQAINQQDAQSAKQHFLAAMKFFKETNDKINSLNTSTSNDQQAAEITQLKSEIMRLGKMETLLKNIATSNNINVDFTKFDKLAQIAQNDLNAGNIDGAKTAINAARDFLVETHNSLTSTAQEISSARAKSFTEKQIERFSKMNEANPSTTPLTTPPSTKSVNATGINATSSVTIQSTTGPVQNYPNVPVQQNPEEMVAKLKKLVSEGKVDEALKVIKILEAYQKEKVRTVEHERQQSSPTGQPNTAENTTNNIPPPPIPPPTVPTQQSTNTTKPNVNSTTTSIAGSTMPPLGSTVSLTVNSLDLSGNQITGMWTVLRTPSGTTLASGFTPKTFTVTSGSMYIVHIGNYHSTVFDHWSDGSTSSYKSITPTQDTVLNAYYHVGIAQSTEGEHQQYYSEKKKHHDHQDNQGN